MYEYNINYDNNINKKYQIVLMKYSLYPFTSTDPFPMNYSIIVFFIFIYIILDYLNSRELTLYGYELMCKPQCLTNFDLIEVTTENTREVIHFDNRIPSQ